MIVFSLLHPNQAKPIKTWTFEVCDVLRVGRASNSDIVLHSSIVSRRHLELWNHETHWELINFGANGTYVDGKLVEQVTIQGEITIRLGSAGPRLQIRCEPTPRIQSDRSPLEGQALPKTSLIKSDYDPDRDDEIADFGDV